MTEHLSNGQFAPKEVAGTKVVRKGAGRGRGRPFKNGHAKLGGRQKGTPNVISRDIKEWMATLIAKPGVQDAIEERILRGDAVAFLRIVEQVIGKPMERQNVTLDANVDGKLDVNVFWRGKTA